MEQEIKFGVVATDTMTGFTGIVYGHSHFMTGCDQYMLVPKIADDGSYREPKWFDVERLRVDDTRPVIGFEDRGSLPPGGPDERGPAR